MNPKLSKWLEAQPEAIRKLAAEFPLGQGFQTKEGKRIFLIGYQEPDTLIFSFTDPRENYQEAVKNRMYSCAKHYRKKP